MNSFRLLRAASAVALCAAGACSYGYRNPAERLDAGEVAGRVVAAASPRAGVAVSLRGAPLDAVSRADGHFAVLPLPAGRHTLLFRDGTDRALARDLEIAPGKDGQPQGVWLGDVEVPAAASVSGVVEPDGAVTLAQNGLVLDDVTGAVALVAPGRSGAFALVGLGPGEHRLRAWVTDTTGAPWVGGPFPVTLSAADAGATRTFAAPLPLHRGGTGTATVTFRAQVVGAAPGLSPSQLTISGLPASAGASFDASGVARFAVPEGRWTVGVAVPPGAERLAPPPTVTFVAVAGDTLELGTLYVVAATALSRVAGACHDDADCAPSGACSAGVCAPWSPPEVAPATAAPCDPGGLGCQPGPYGSAPYTATCVAGAFAGGAAAVACGSCCTPDGVVQICGDAGAGGCPPAVADVRLGAR